jgi:hypothetical protein
VDKLISELEIPHKGVSRTWSGNSWQRLRLGEFSSLPDGFPVYRYPAGHDGQVAAELALAIPVLAEAWNRQTTLNEVWQSIKERIGTQLTDYFPGRKPYSVNGKSHVRETYEALAREGLFRQYLVRFRDTCSLFVLSPSYSRNLPDPVAQQTRLAELFPTKDGGGLWRLHGSWELLRARESLAYHTIYFVEDRRPPEVQFCYEWLFDPRKSCWRFSASLIRRHMGCARDR